MTKKEYIENILKLYPNVSRKKATARASWGYCDKCDADLFKGNGESKGICDILVKASKRNCNYVFIPCRTCRHRNKRTV